MRQKLSLMPKPNLNDSPAVSIIIPVFRDTPALNGCLNHPNHASMLNTMTVVLGERDEGAQALCEKHAVRWLQAPSAGRARQMNFGAAKTEGTLLLFLHADTRLPPQALTAIVSASRSGAIGGGFKRHFEHPSRFLRLTCWLAAWRARLIGWLFGDQAIFVRRQSFLVLGGFPERPCFEDLEFSRRLRRLGKTALIDTPILTSARRFQRHGPIRQTWSDLLLTIHYLVKSHRSYKR